VKAKYGNPYSEFVL